MSEDRMTSYTIAYGNRQISYDVVFSDRQTLEISVHPDCSVVVKSPANAEISKIEKRVKNRARWILKQQDYFEQFCPRITPHQYINGETHLYLGKRYRLNIVKANLCSVKLRWGEIQIQTNAPNNSEKTRQLLAGWYRERAAIKFNERFVICWNCFKRSDFSCPVLQIRHLAKRWGSLTPTGKIILNLDLIRADLSCIDYVIIHELCHLKHPNHSKRFYEFLSQVMPDWKSRKQRLEQLLVTT